MNIVRSLGLAAVLAATAATADAAVVYADSVLDYNMGSGVTKPSRMNPTAALGTPDGRFVSLGLGGDLTVDFGTVFKSPGAVWEITFGDRDQYVETADIYVGSGMSFTFVGSLLNNIMTSTFTFTGTYDKIKIVDTSPALPGHDGFDIDAISVHLVPVPAAGLLLLSAIGAVSILRRRTA